MAYADLTTRDPNRVKRWLQNRRFRDAVGTLPPAGTAPLRILDFGAGDGELVRQIALRQSIEACVYEPTPRVMAEAKEKLSGVPGVKFRSSLESVESGSFDYVFCLEVFEHLPRAETDAALAEMHRLVKPNGFVVIGVPHELFLPALLKGLFRMTRRYGAFDASPRTILAAVRGRPPSERPSMEISPGFAYFGAHLGFDYRDLEGVLQERFRVIRRWFSPIPMLGSALNSEVYYLLQKPGPSAGLRPDAIA
jgi:SAM-dependent methyltransferase